MGEKLSSRLGFIMLAAGCAVGLGNVWRFPYVAGANGGAVFVFVYLAFLAVLGFPLLVVELAIGRGGARGIAGSMRALGGRRAWGVLGFVLFLGNLLLLSFYTDVTGWLLRCAASYAGLVAPPDLAQLTGNDAAETGFMVAVVAGCTGVCFLGLVKGVERVSKVMMLLLLALLVVMATRSCLLPGAAKGIAFYLKPDWTKFMAHPGRAVLEAMGQAFFTLSIGIGAMAIFGSYVDRAHSLAKEAVLIILIDTSVALLSGLIVFPVCMTYGVDPASGPMLIFEALPQAFARERGGAVWGFLFFFFLLLAAATTIIAILECLVAGLREGSGWGRRTATGVVGVVVIAISLPCVLCAGALEKEDALLSNVWLPLGALAQVLFVLFGWGWTKFRAEASAGRGFAFPGWMRFHLSVIVPLLIALLMMIRFVG